MTMDKELDQYLDDNDPLTTMDEEKYRMNAGRVHAQFEEKMRREGSKLRFAQDLIALFRYFMDPDVSWQKKTFVVAALVYFILPLDTIPDVAPIVGYLDDFGVILAVTSFMSAELEPYYSAQAPAPAATEDDDDIDFS